MNPSHSDKRVLLGGERVLQSNDRHYGTTAPVGG
jgi:hypothetical protein